MTWLLAKLLLISLTAVLSSCNGRQLSDHPKHVSVDATPTPKTLRVDNEDFSIDLDAEWTMERESESHIFNDNKQLQQITIAVLWPNETLTGPRVEHLGRESIRMRQNAIRKLSGGKVKFGDINSERVREGYDLTFSATDQANDVKIRSTTFARPQRIVTVTFNKYSPFPSDQEIERRFAAILTKIKLKES